jgi:hypothetical protein
MGSSFKDFEKPIDMPTLSICRIPPDKNATYLSKLTYEGRTITNRTLMQHILNKTFYTKPTETIIHIAIGPDYITAIKRPTEIPIGPPYVQSVFVDLMYNGVCMSIPFSELRKYLLAKEEILETDVDFGYVVVVWLKVNLHHL